MFHSQKQHHLDAKDSPASAGGGALRLTDDKFVGWMPEPETNETKVPRGIPRLLHKKSKTGCQRCRARRVKCNEVHPICGGCLRHRVTCTYDHPKKAVEKASTGDSEDSKTSQPTASSGNTLESKTQRLLEVKLMHHYTLHTSLTFPLSGDPNSRELNTTQIPNLAFTNDALLYSIYFITALHLFKSEPSNSEALKAYHNYLDLAIRSHRADVAQLSSRNADPVCLTSSLIRFGSFAILQERSLDPYTPPIQWLHMNRGCAEVFRTAWFWIGNRETSIAAKGIKRTPDLTDTAALFAECNRQSLLHLLARHPHHQETEPWDAEIQEAYESTLSYIGGVQLAIAANNEEPRDICRRLIAFPGLIEKKRFYDLVEEAQPRALVVLAHYFALLARFRDIWWVGDAGVRELKAISGVLGGEWQEMIDWPMKAVEEIYS